MSSGLYSNNVKKFIEENINDLDNGNYSRFLFNAHLTLDCYECNVVSYILSTVIDDNYDKYAKEALLNVISDMLIAFKHHRSSINNISIPAFIHSFMHSVFNLPEKEVVQLIIDNKDRWPNHIKWDQSLNQWRVFK